MRPAPLLFAIPVLFFALALVSLRASFDDQPEVTTVQMNNNVYAVNIQY